MDDVKCRELKAELAAQLDPPFVAIDRFFDGNDDLGSIGCNLDPHPGIDRFRRALVGLLSRDDVEAVYALIAELDPGDGCWPFTDTVLVIGSIPMNELQSIMAALQPNEIGVIELHRVPPTIIDRHQSPITAIWWD